MTNKRSLTGIRPSGDVHLGNYLGTIKPALALQKDHHCLYFIVDLHALTTEKNPERLRRQTYDLVATWLALGFDADKHILYRQSDIASVTELTWYLSCVTGMGLLEKAHAYKDAAAKDHEVTHGVFAYPVLMAADILLYEPDVVPVGKDQKQHVEMARNMAGSFNAVYGEGLLKLPEPLVDERVMTIPGLDGRKMSKSYDNVIPLFADRDTLKKRVMSIKTDSTPLEAPKSMKGSLLGDLFELIASSDEANDLEQRLSAGGLGWGHAKLELFEAIDRHVKEPRERYEELRKDEPGLRRVLATGAEKAHAIADPILGKVRRAIGVSLV